MGNTAQSSSASTIRLNGVDFDRPSEAAPREVTRWKEGARTKFVGLNLCEWHSEGGASVCWQYTLSLSSHGACALDGRPLKGEDAERAKGLFAELGLAP